MRKLKYKELELFNVSWKNIDEYKVLCIGSIPIFFITTENGFPEWFTRFDDIYEIAGFEKFLSEEEMEILNDMTGKIKESKLSNILEKSLLKMLTI